MVVVEHCVNLSKWKGRSSNVIIVYYFVIFSASQLTFSACDCDGRIQEYVRLYCLRPFLVKQHTVNCTGKAKRGQESDSKEDKQNCLPLIFSVMLIKPTLWIHCQMTTSHAFGG